MTCVEIEAVIRLSCGLPVSGSRFVSGERDVQIKQISEKTIKRVVVTIKVLYNQNRE